MLKKQLKELIYNKRICVLGYGREGKSTLKLLLESGGYKEVMVSDMRDVSESLPDEVKCISGAGYLDCLDDFDVVFKTPGVVLPKEEKAYSCLITSQTEEFIRCFGRNVIGITGTKGKSTTSSLIYHILKEAKKDVLFAGNIGVPVFDIASEINKDTIIVIELSCHQLEYAKSAPHIAVLLNIFEDHLDHYGTREKYGKAKQNIYLKQSEEDYLFTTEETLEEWGSGKSVTECITSDMLPFLSFDELKGVCLRGAHNLLNAAFAYRVVKMFGVNDEVFVKAIETFETLPHRLEYLGNIAGVDYYDDSISTTVKSAISAVESISNAAILLVGGMERNIAYEELVEYVAKSKLKYLVCMYESGERIFDMYNALCKNSDATQAVKVETLGEAVAFSKENAKEGEAVLLSPAAASYGYFKNFEERGDMFREMVRK